MSQSKRHSAIESLTNAVLGLVISWTFTILVFQTTPTFALGITLSYAGLSWIRSYAIRRLFNRLRPQSFTPMATEARH